MILNLRQSVVVRFERLQWNVRRVEREVDEERAIAIGVDSLDRFVAEIIGHVLRGIESMAAVARYGERQIGPQELVDRIEILNRVLDRGIVRAQIHRRTGQKSQRL